MVENPMPLGGPLFQRHIVSVRVVESGGVLDSPPNDMILRRYAGLQQLDRYGQSRAVVEPPPNENEDIYLEAVMGSSADLPYYDFGPAIARTPSLDPNPYDPNS